MIVSSVNLLCSVIMWIAVGSADGFILGRNMNLSQMGRSINLQFDHLSASSHMAFEPPEDELAVSVPTTVPKEDELHLNLQYSDDILHDARSQKNVNEAINSFVIGSIIASFALWLYHIDSSLPHPPGSSFLDALTRVPVEGWESYRGSLLDSPIATKAATSASVYAIGDVISQKTEGATNDEIDRYRTLRSLVAGFVGHGPLSHFWYIYLDSFFNDVLHMTEWWSFIPKILIDQTTWTPFWNNSYILLIGLMKLDSFKNITSDMRRTTIPLIMSGLKLWPFAHMITYGVIPEAYRLAWVDLVEILWVTILATKAAAASKDREVTVDGNER